MVNILIVYVSRLNRQRTWKNFRQTFKVTPQLHMESSLSSGAIGPLTDKDAIYIRRNIGYVKELAPFTKFYGGCQ